MSLFLKLSANAQMPIKLDRTGIFGWSQNIKVPISLRIPTRKWRKNGVEEPAVRSCENRLLQHYQQYLSCPAHKPGSFFACAPAQRDTRRFTSRRSVLREVFPPREAVAECPVLFIERGESPNDICLSFYIRRIKLGCAVDVPFYHPTLCWNRRTLSAQFRFQYINRSNFPFWHTV